MVKNDSMNYVKNNKSTDKLVRTEILLMPLLVFAPLIVGILLIYDWVSRDFLTGELDLFGELILAIIIIFFNILFDVPFIKSLRKLSKEKKT